jgi:signal transduction histidine kinase
MASGVAHDINNALSPITAYSELLLSTLPDLAEAPRQRLERISQAAEDVAQIVARMREFYRRDLDPRRISQEIMYGTLKEQLKAPVEGTARAGPLQARTGHHHAAVGPRAGGRRRAGAQLLRQ